MPQPNEHTHTHIAQLTQAKKKMKQNNNTKYVIIDSRHTTANRIDVAISIYVLQFIESLKQSGIPQFHMHVFVQYFVFLFNFFFT